MSAFKVASHLKTLITTTVPIVLENEKASTPFHIRVTQVPLSPTVLTVGINRITQHTGLIQLDCFTAIATGQGDGQALVDLIINSIPFGHYTDADDFKFIINNAYELPGYLTPRDQSGTFYIKSVRVEYEYFV